MSIEKISVDNYLSINFPYYILADEMGLQQG